MIKFLKNNYKYGIIIIALLIIGQCVLNLQNDKKRLHEDLIGKTQKYQQLSDHAAKLEIQYKTQKDLNSNLESNWAAEKDSLKGRIKILSNATFLIREKARVSNNSDLVYKGKRMKYVVNEIKFNDGPPIGYVLIFDDGRVTSKIYNHIIDVKTAVSRNESTGEYNIISKADYVLRSPSLNLSGENWYKKPYPLKIIGGSAMIDPTEPVAASKKRFFLWSLNINGGIHLYTDSITPSVSASIMGYGYSTRDLDWKFIDLGVEYSDNKERGFALNVTPVLYRPIPKILKNTYVGPGISFDSYGKKYFLGISIGF